MAAGETPNRIVLLGKPGSGHRGHAARLARGRRVPLITAGGLIRQAVVDAEELGERIREQTESAGAVSDDQLATLVRDRVAEPDCRTGFLLRGFPRTAGQAAAIDAVLAAADAPLTRVVELQMSDAVLAARAAGWRHCPRDGRRFHADLSPPMLADICDECGSPLAWLERDRAPAVAARIATFCEEIASVVEYYRQTDGLVEAIDGTGSPNEVAARLLVALESRS